MGEKLGKVLKLGRVAVGATPLYQKGNIRGLGFFQISHDMSCDRTSHHVTEAHITHKLTPI